jgi:hypothetical protein
VKGLSPLGGYRGAPLGDTEALAQTTVAVSRLAIDRPEVVEAETDPVSIAPAGQEVVALDALVRCDSAVGAVAEQVRHTRDRSARPASGVERGPSASVGRRRHDEGVAAGRRRAACGSPVAVICRPATGPARVHTDSTSVVASFA